MLLAQQIEAVIKYAEQFLQGREGIRESEQNWCWRWRCAGRKIMTTQDYESPRELYDLSVLEMACVLSLSSPASTADSANQQWYFFLLCLSQSKAFFWAVNQRELSWRWCLFATPAIDVLFSWANNNNVIIINSLLENERSNGPNSCHDFTVHALCPMKIYGGGGFW